MIWFSSDLHFCHELPNMYQQRGFQSADEMNLAIVQKWNRKVKPDDEVFLLGDLMLTDTEKGMTLFRQLNGVFHIILGNHDTTTRQQLYAAEPNVKEVVYSTVLKYGGFHFYLCHYATFTGHFDTRPLKEDLICLFGHTHQKGNFYIYPGTEIENGRMYHVGLDSHNLEPVSIDQIIADLIQKAQEEGCKVAVPKVYQTEEEKAEKKKQKQEYAEQCIRYVQTVIQPDDVLAKYRALYEEGKVPRKPTKKDLGQIVFILPEEIINHYEAIDPQVFRKLGKEKRKRVGKQVIEIIKREFELI